MLKLSALCMSLPHEHATVFSHGVENEIQVTVCIASINRAVFYSKLNAGTANAYWNFNQLQVWLKLS